jgi:hypothetical protein
MWHILIPGKRKNSWVLYETTHDMAIALRYVEAAAKIYLDVRMQWVQVP